MGPGSSIHSSSCEYISRRGRRNGFISRYTYSVSMQVKIQLAENLFFSGKRYVRIDVCTDDSRTFGGKMRECSISCSSSLRASQSSLSTYQHCKLVKAKAEAFKNSKTASIRDSSLPQVHPLPSRSIPDPCATHSRGQNPSQATICPVRSTSSSDILQQSQVEPLAGSGTAAPSRTKTFLLSHLSPSLAAKTKLAEKRHLCPRHP